MYKAVSRPANGIRDVEGMTELPAAGAVDATGVFVIDHATSGHQIAPSLAKVLCLSGT